MKNMVVFAYKSTPLAAENNIFAERLSKYSDIWAKVEGSTFVVCKKGTLRVTINLNEYTIRENDYVTLLGRSYIHIHEFSPDVEFSYVWFSPEVLHEGEFFKKEFKSLLLIYENPVKRISDGLRTYLEKSISSWGMIKDIPEIADNREIFRNIMNTCLHTSMDLYGIDEPEERLDSRSKSYSINEQFIRLVTVHYRKERSISFYAENIGTTKENLCRIVKGCSHMTPLGIMNALLVFDAKTQLKFTQSSITEIGTSLGFPTLAAFCRFFRKYAGQTPSEYRNL